MSNYGQQPPYGPNPYGPQNPYGQPQQPYGRPAQPPYGQPQPYSGQPNPYAPPSPGQAQPGPGQPYAPGYPASPGQWPGPTPPARAARSLLVVTTDSVPGREVTGVLGEVVGVVARSRELPQELRTPNPLDGYAVMLTRSRQDAVQRLVEMARTAGADAVVGLRYDSSEITQTLSEVVAYGTAVTLNGRADEAPNPAEQASQPSGSSVRRLDPPDFVGTVDLDAAGPPAPEQEAAEGPAGRSGSSVAPTQPWPPPPAPDHG